MISHPFPYRIIRSSRKTLAIQVSVSGQVTVRAPHTMPDSTIQRFLSQKESAAYARKMGVTYGRITIREQKTRWGSCTSEGNLNFNWRLIFAPEKVLDYAVVHDLSHRKEMNHSPAFYAVVASVMPEYKACEKWLRDNGATLWQNPSP